MFSSWSKAPPPQLEKRVDPQDGVARTYEQVRTKYLGQYSEQQIKGYWDFEMLQVEGESMHSVVNDPFMTHGAHATRPATGARHPGHQPGGELADVKKDPFLSQFKNPSVGHAGHATMDPSKDPFYIGSGVSQPYGTMDSGRRERLANAVVRVERHWMESLFRLLGPGDPSRDMRSRNMLIGAPWLLFMWLLVVWLVLRHFSDPGAAGLAMCALLGSGGAMLSWYQGRRGGPVSYMSLGILCLLATVGATIAGHYGWEVYWRQFWWTHTGFRGPATAETAAMARSDYAVVDFWDPAAGATLNGSRVDYLRSAGYKDDDYFCVAPILSPASAEAGLARVNFWAVGINCCQRYGSFTCGDSRVWDAGAAVVMLGDGFPCPSCNVENFKAAVTKAEAVHGLVSADGARFVLWVKDTSAMETKMMLQCVAYVLLCAVLAGGYFTILGWLAWYYGLFLELDEEEALFAATETALKERGLAGELQVEPEFVTSRVPPRDR